MKTSRRLSNRKRGFVGEPRDRSSRRPHSGGCNPLGSPPPRAQKCRQVADQATPLATPPSFSTDPSHDVPKTPVTQGGGSSAVRRFCLCLCLCMFTTHAPPLTIHICRLGCRGLLWSLIQLLLVLQAAFLTNGLPLPPGSPCEDGRNLAADPSLPSAP